MEYLLKVSAIIIIFYFTYKVFLQRDTFFESNRGFLLLGLITSFIIPFLVIPIYIEHTPTLISNYNFGEATAVEKTAEPFNILDYLPIVYLVGVLFFSIRLLIQFVSLFTLIFKNKSEKHGVFTFVKVNSNVSPFSFFNWIVYNPNQFNETELDQIITHEKVHVQQYHSIDILLTQLSCIVLWFNPFIWLYNKNLKQNLEFLADNSAINNTKSKKDYQYALLKTSLPTHQLALSNNFYNSLIKKRIVMLHKSKSKKINQFKFAIVIPLLAIFLMSFNTEKVYVAKALKETVKIEKEKSNEDKPKPNLKVKEIKTEHAISRAINNRNDINTKVKSNIEMILITKDFTDTDLDNLISKLKKKGISIKFKGIKRNSSGEITGIKINVSSKGSNANYNVSSNETISPVKISFEDDGKKISIGSANSIHKHKDSKHVVKDKKHKVYTIEKSHGVSVISDVDVDEKVEVIIENDVDVAHEKNVIILNLSDDDKSYKAKTAGKVKSSNKIIFIGDNNQEPLFILDGKETSKKEFEALDRNGFESIQVIKDKDAIKKYGDKGKNGAVIISTKGKKNEKIILRGLNSGTPPLYIINGKEAKKEDFEKLSPDEIKSLKVIKNLSAIKKHGDKGKNGIVEITTKKE